MNNTDKIGNVADKPQHSVGGSAGARTDTEIAAINAKAAADLKALCAEMSKGIPAILNKPEVRRALAMQKAVRS